MLTRLHPPPDETPTLPPHIRPHHSLCFCTPTSSSPWLKILTLLRGPQVMPPKGPSPAQHTSDAAYHPYRRSALPKCLQCSLPSLRLWSSFPTCLQCRLASLRLYSARLTCLQRCLPSLRLQYPPNKPPMPLTILTLAVTCQHASDASSHPYAHIVPSRPASNATYHPYARIVPAQHASDTAYHPYACGALPTCLQCPPHTGLILMLLQPPQDETTMLPPISALTTPYASAPPSR
ncbi:hypothetical protein O181_056384 [Austropuccinia psidii MF-1]|uniref:Uncharacterized protein n=1 Tax=Austropuccinia psidii MF-1 TaxID=1389203 RepID=A0A9Q3HVL2_9BASI|nr:hypothetical protein [Austropuccinia psidii MF-1]